MDVENKLRRVMVIPSIAINWLAGWLAYLAIKAKIVIYVQISLKFGMEVPNSLGCENKKL